MNKEFHFKARLTGRQADKLRNLSHATGLNQSQVVRFIIDNFDIAPPNLVQKTESVTPTYQGQSNAFVTINN